MAEKLTERGVIKELKEFYTPHFNLYHKMFFEKKVSCYDKNTGDVQKYYTCLKKVDTQMMKNSDFLRQSFGQVDLDIEKYRTQCKNNFAGDETKFEECNQKVLKQMRFSAKKTYDEYYKKQVGGRSEYRKIK